MKYVSAIVFIIVVIVYTLVVVALRRARIVRAHKIPLAEHANQTKFPLHVRQRGFASASYQESGGYGSDALIGGRIVHVPGTLTDWSWRASRSNVPPEWARGLLPAFFARGNRADEWLDRDLELMKRAGATTYRFSMCWAKLQPVAFQALDAAQVTMLNSKLRRCRDNALTPLLTIIHFVLPAWCPGWHDAKALEQFADFVRRIAHAVDAFADAQNEEWWITLNEPSIATVHGYVIGSRPPGRCSIPLALQAYANMLRAHVMCASILKARRKGVVHAVPAWNVSLFAPRVHGWIADELFATALDALFNRAVLTLIVKGAAWVGPYFVQGESPSKRPVLAINTYTRVTVSVMAPPPDVDHETQPEGKTLCNDLRWDLSPAHLYSVLESVRQAAPNARVIITEHGIPDRGDAQRCRLLRHTCRVLHATPQVEGSHHWSFTRNQEWELALCGNFGVVDVDFANGCRRTPRRSYNVLQSLWSESASKVENMQHATLATYGHHPRMS